MTTVCLAVPVRIVEIQPGDVGVFEIEGALNEVRLSLLDDVLVGDYVLVHAGFAIEKLDEEDALKTLAMFDEIAKEAEKLNQE